MKREPTAKDWVRARRTAAGVTQQQFAKEVGLTLRDVQRIEQGDLRMSYKKYLAVAEYYGVMLDEILYGEVDE